MCGKALEPTLFKKRTFIQVLQMRRAEKDYTSKLSLASMIFSPSKKKLMNLKKGYCKRNFATSMP